KAVVLQRDDREVQVWQSDQQRIEVIDACDCPQSATVGTPIELKIDARCRVLECKVLDRPLKMQTQIGVTMFLDIFIFPQPHLAFSIYFGAITVDSQFSPVDSDRSYLAYVTWDKRRSEMVILKQTPPRNAAINEEEWRQLRDEYEKYLQSEAENERKGEHPKKEKLTVAIPPMERRAEERSFSDRMSSISSKLDSVSMREEKRQMDGKTSVRSSNDARINPYPVRHSIPLNERNDSSMSRSGRGGTPREGGMTSSYSGIPSVVEEVGWEKGVVASENRGDSQHPRKFIVSTKKGNVDVYQRVFEGVSPPLKVGDYVEVKLRPQEGSATYDVEDMEMAKSKPMGLKSQMHDGILMITCDAKYIKRAADDYKSWWVAENSYLGRIGVEGVREGGDMVGKTTTITVKHLRPGISIALEKSGVQWIETKIPTIVKARETPKLEQKKAPSDGWYTGMVCGVDETTVFIASPYLKMDAVLYATHDPDEVMGLWIKFQLNQQHGDPTGRQRIDEHTFRRIDPVYQTRMVKGMPEIRVTLSYGGEEDDGKPMLRSEMGVVRDCEGLIPTDRDSHGLYNGWIMRYQRSNHVSRWRFSREGANIEKTMEREGIRSRSPSPTTLKHRAIEEDRMRQERLGMMDRDENREENENQEEIEYEEGELELREIMRRVILENDEIRFALIDADRDAYNEMFDILMNENI
ncbi:hypothetical protein PMAYCL1PPCAC_18584, partial [Pristionchus mayeri]